MPIKLSVISESDLRRLAQGQSDDDLEESLPSHVILRSLTLLQAGHPAIWCSPYRVIRTHDGVVVGSCGFKGIPVDGAVEIGYAIEPQYRGQHMARAAVRALLAIAFQDSAIQQVNATIRPDNLASIRVVELLAFCPAESLKNIDGEMLLQWHCRRPDVQERKHRVSAGA